MVVSTNRRSVGELLRHYRTSAGLTQEDLAVRAGLSMRGIQMIEHDRVKPQRGTVARLSQGLGLSDMQRVEFAAVSRVSPRHGSGVGDSLAFQHHEQTGSPLPNVRGLPHQLTSFVGREVDLATVQRLLTASRLVTLTGAGGSGKTRLALQAAAQVQASYPDGVYLVELAAVENPLLVPQGVAAAVGILEQPPEHMLTMLVSSLRQQKLLIVLDNCEHLIAACAVLVETLLRTCPDLHVLTTSREALGIGGETRFGVPPLATPSLREGSSPEALMTYEAVRLFVARARAVDPHFDVTPENAAAVARVCSALDGMPLAIELAAARVRMLSPEQIVARLDNRFHLLSDGERTLLPRQQTLRATIDWSYALLTDQERLLFTRLSVFAANWTIEAAEIVCSDEDDSTPETTAQCPGMSRHDVFHLLTHLVDKSLVTVEVGSAVSRQPPDGDATGSTWRTSSVVRYRMLESLRQYAWERLTAQRTQRGMADAGVPDAGGAPCETTDLVRDRHARYYRCLGHAALRQWEQEHVRAVARPSLVHLAPDFDNLQVAIGWSLERQDVEQAYRLALICGGLWQPLGRLTEGRHRLAAVLAADDTPSDLRTRVLTDAAWLAWLQGDYATSRTAWDEIVATYRAWQDRSHLAASLNGLSVMARDANDFGPARMMAEESRTIYEAMDDRRGVADSLARLASIAQALGDLTTARNLFHETLSLRKRVGESGPIAWTLYSLAVLALDEDDPTIAARFVVESLPVFQSMADGYGVLHGLSLASCVAAARGAAVQTLRLGAAAVALGETTTVRLPLVYHERVDQWLGRARAGLSTELAESAWNRGRTLSRDAAIAEALVGVQATSDASDAAHETSAP